MLGNSLWFVMSTQISQGPLDVNLCETLGRVEPARRARPRGYDQTTRLEFSDEVPINAQSEDRSLANVLLSHKYLIQAVLFVLGPSHLTVHLEEETLAIEVLEVLPLDVPHHLLDVVVAVRVVHLPVAEAAH